MRTITISMFFILVCFIALAAVWPTGAKWAIYNIAQVANYAGGTSTGLSGFGSWVMGQVVGPLISLGLVLGLMWLGAKKMFGLK